MGKRCQHTLQTWLSLYWNSWTILGSAFRSSETQRRLCCSCPVFEILLSPLPFSYHNRVIHRDALRWHLLKHSSQLTPGPKLPGENIIINSDNRSPPYSHCCSQLFTTCCRAYFLPRNCKQSRKQRKVAHVPHWRQLTACMRRRGRGWWAANGRLCHEKDHKRS